MFPQCKKHVFLAMAILVLLTMVTACGGSGGNASGVFAPEESVSVSDDSAAISDADVDSSTAAHDTSDAQTTKKTKKTIKKSGSQSTKKTTAKTTTESDAQTNAASTSGSLNATGTTTNKEPMELDFVLEFPDGEDITVLQLSTLLIRDKYGETLCYKYIRETVKKAQPDLILITGDLVYGRFDTDGSLLVSLIEFMESLGIPWAPVLGNHEAASPVGVDWQCQQLEQAENCLFVQRELTGNGNYTIGIKQGGTIKRVFFMMDSNGCAMLTNANAHSNSLAGFGKDQKEWFSEVSSWLKTQYRNVKISMAFHLQIQAFRTALQKYGFTNNNTAANPINLDTKDGVADGDFGYIGENLNSPWDMAGEFFNTMKRAGVDSILVGHEHCNSASVMHNGIRFQYGQKSSVNDKSNYLKPDGTIVAAYRPGPAGSKPLVGGTVMKLSKTDASITDAYIQYWDR